MRRTVRQKKRTISVVAIALAFWGMSAVASVTTQTKQHEDWQVGVVMPSGEDLSAFYSGQRAAPMASTTDARGRLEYVAQGDRCTGVLGVFIDTPTLERSFVESAGSAAISFDGEAPYKVDTFLIGEGGDTGVRAIILLKGAEEVGDMLVIKSRVSIKLDINEAEFNYDFSLAGAKEAIARATWICKFSKDN